MFANIKTAPFDPLFAVATAFRTDARSFKMDLGLGVYRNETGITPVLDVVKQAEVRLASESGSKIYGPLSGDAGFNLGMSRLLLGHASSALDRTVTIQTVGGTGALRMLAELVFTANSGATAWLSNPGYHNHRPLMSAAGLAIREYPWIALHGSLDIEPMIEGLAEAKAGDILVLQGCCHNPTGIDLRDEDWGQIADFCSRRGVIPLVDLAYQGLGRGLDQDAYGLRLLVDRLETVLVAASCSKNMGLYSERTGAALVTLPSTSSAAATRSVLEAIGRRSYSVPPAHGAAVACALFADPAPWHLELDAMRERIVNVRNALADHLLHKGAPSHFQDIRIHRGMFSTLPFNSGQMEALRRDFAIYGSPEGRINVAGISGEQITQLAEALLVI